jgi:saccharopine dehydrogenase-like NADP-dependent oxidoreductase
MDREPNVQQIICADYDLQAVKSIVKSLKKAIPVQVDASSLNSILAASKLVKQPIDLVVNALPLDYGKNALDAALKLKANYQDFAAPEKIGKT